MAEDIEVELAAIKTLVQTLEPLKSEVRARVIDHAFKVLGIEAPKAAPPNPAQSPPPLPGQPAPAPPLAPPSSLHVDGPVDIFSFKEQKGPTTAAQMIAVVAYYLAHLATEHQDFITADDIQKYFMQARYPMPGSNAQALVHAKNAGYLDVLERGKYRLNSVGYNLVAHKMPKDGSAPSRRPAKKSANKGKK